jgi:ribosomal protein S27AE
VELSLKLKELKESQQEAMMIRIRETCPDCGFSSAMADMHYIWKPDTEWHSIKKLKKQQVSWTSVICTYNQSKIKKSYSAANAIVVLAVA